jgi:hypothetical protein
LTASFGFIEAAIFTTSINVCVIKIEDCQYEEIGAGIPSAPAPGIL